jgi:hypothetical protein
MTISFKGEQVSFWIRLIKKLGPIVLVLGILFFRVKYGKTFSEDSKIYFYIFGVICFFIGLYYHIRDIRTVVTEVKFIDDKFQVLGLDFNSKFNDSLKINDTTLEIKQKEKSEKLYIEIYSNDKYYYINSYSDWNKETLIDIIKEYRKRTDRTVYGIDLIPEIINT